ncbi:VOC family protein [Kaarinaea lacus]
MIKTKAIDHVCLWVRSVAEAKDYYEKVFGFVCAPRGTDNTTLVVESENVHFFLSETKNHNDFLLKQHISFEVESLQSVIDNLNALGISQYQLGEVSLFTHKNYKWCEWKDPSGIRLECVELV